MSWSAVILFIETICQSLFATLKEMHPLRCEEAGLVGEAVRLNGKVKHADKDARNSNGLSTSTIPFNNETPQQTLKTTAYMR
jgi:hypothetical protein